MRKKMCLWKSFYQESRDWVGTAVVVLGGFVFALPQTAWEDRVIAEVSVCCPATVDVDGTPLGGGTPDISGVEGCRVKKNSCAGVTDEMLRCAEIISLKREPLSGLCCAG